MGIGTLGRRGWGTVNFGGPAKMEQGCAGLHKVTDAVEQLVEILLGEKSPGVKTAGKRFGVMVTSRKVIRVLDSVM